MSVRKVFFWLHLAAGTVGGVIILTMSVTGAILMYRPLVRPRRARGADIRRKAVYVNPYTGAFNLAFCFLVISKWFKFRGGLRGKTRGNRLTPDACGPTGAGMAEYQLATTQFTPAAPT